MAGGGRRTLFRPGEAEAPGRDRGRPPGLLDRIEEAHGKEGFRVLGWHGLEIPRTWPSAIWSMLYTAYAQSLQTEGLPQ